MYVRIAFRSCVLANRTLFMALSVLCRGEERGLTVTTACLFSHVPSWPAPAACDHSQAVALTNRLTHQVPSTYTHNGFPCTSLARVLRPAGRKRVEKDD